MITATRKETEVYTFPTRKGDICKAYLLTGHFKRAIHAQIRDRYGKIPALMEWRYGYDGDKRWRRLCDGKRKEHLKNGNRVYNGSNPFYVVAVNTLAESSDLRVIYPTELEDLLTHDLSFFDTTYVDSALAVRKWIPHNKEDPNLYVHEKLMESIAEKGRAEDYPFIIPLADLEIIKDKKSPYELIFAAKESAQLIPAPQLSGENTFRKFENTDEYALPTGIEREASRKKECRFGSKFAIDEYEETDYVDDGKRRILSSNDCLTRFFIGANGALSAVSSRLDHATRYGRVLLVARE